MDVTLENKKKSKLGVKQVSALIGGVYAAILPLLIIFMLLSLTGNKTETDNTAFGNAQVSQDVLKYKPLIEKYATENNISEFVNLIMAVMMQESGGRGLDPMQCSECGNNTQYPRHPNGITDPEYSIRIGIKELATVLATAQCTTVNDMPKVKLALQGYNFGGGYIAWATRNYGGYTPENAAIFSDQQAQSHGWARYGDKEYVPHVLRYYNTGTTGAGARGASEVGVNAANYAKSKVGCAYNQALRTAPNIFDCSSLAFRCYTEIGYSFPDLGSYPPIAATEAQWIEQNNKTVSAAELQAGDWIFYGGRANGRYKGIYHIAIYYGNGMQVEAASTQLGVIFTEFRESNIGLYGRPY